jgi:hypothetical protein
MTMPTDDDRYIFPPEVRTQMLKMHHDEWQGLKKNDPIRGMAVEQATSSLLEAFPELDHYMLADMFAFIVSSMKGSLERGGTLSSVLNGYGDICSELTDMGYTEVADE